MATSLLGLGLALQGGAAAAQGLPAQNAWQNGAPSSPYPVVQAPAPNYPPPPPPPVQTLQFHRDAAPAGGFATSGISPVAQQEKLPLGVQEQPQYLQKQPIDYTMEFRGVREVPGLERLMIFESEKDLQRRMQQEALKYGEKLIFPDEPVLSKEPYPGRIWAPKTMIVEPSYVAHGRLLFEQQNFERGLWDFGILTPVMEVGKFYWDVALLPYHLGTRPCQQVDTSAGKCLPGDPAPFRLYPFELSFSGAVCEAAAVTGLLFIFP